MDSEITIVIADDHPIFREGLKKIIQGKNNFTVIGEAGDGIESLNIIRNLNPQIAVIDIDMPGKNGFEVVTEMKSFGCKTQTIFLTMHNAKDLLEEALSLNVRGFVLKENAITEILDAIEKVNNGSYYVSPQVSNYMFAEKADSGNSYPQKLLLNKLSPTEKKILKLISLQKSTNEIAAELFISPKTIETHRTHIASKLNLYGQNSLLKFAIDNKNVI
jgi:two-component system response regulator NreC